MFTLVINVHNQRLHLQSRYLLATTLILPCHVCLLKAVHHPIFVMCSNSTSYAPLINLYKTYMNICIKVQEFGRYSVHMWHVIAVTVSTLDGSDYHEQSVIVDQPRDTCIQISNSLSICGQLRIIRTTAFHSTKLRLKSTLTSWCA
jgi:hypothetical protein